MPEANKDPAIKLFGITISLSRHNTEVSDNDSPYDDDHSSLSPSSSDPRELSYGTQHEAEMDKEPSWKTLTSLQDDDVSNQTTDDPKSPTSSSCSFVNPKIPSSETEDSIVKSSSSSNNNKNGTQNDTSVLQNDKFSPKKPEKILPCPRCNNMDTKFCYFNNYNVNQPRHFCKNCQRYWTAGGTMRNVPIGAGRRKNKNTPSNNSSSCSDFFSCASSYRQVIVPEIIQRGMLDPPLCNSIASVLSLAEKPEQNDVKNVFHAPVQKYTFVTPTSSDKNMGHSGSHETVEKGYQFNLPLWRYPWNTTMHSPRAFFQKGYPLSFYAKHTHYFATPQSCANHFASSSGPNLSTLGKHSREGNMLPPISSQKENVAKESSKNSENGMVMLPKTLKIDDSCEAAMSSVWSTLRIKNDMAKSLSGGDIFKGYPTKGYNDNFQVVEASPVLQANPTALSKSLIFHKST